MGAWDELHQAVSRFHAVETAEQAEFNPFAIELNQVSSPGALSFNMCFFFLFLPVVGSHHRLCSNPHKNLVP